VQSNRTLKKLYREYNRKYFAGKLPGLPINFLTPGQMKKYFGVARATCAITCFKKGTYTPDSIYISMNQFKPWRYVRADLLHELCHVSKPRASHGKVFQDEMLRIAKLGAFEDAW